jgi:hypothetical protein
MNYEVSCQGRLPSGYLNPLSSVVVKRFGVLHGDELFKQIFTRPLVLCTGLSKPSLLSA